jgi:hypothetical protein
MGRIGETAVGQRVTKQQIAVLIMDSRNGYRQLGQKSKPDADDDEEKGDDRQRLALRQTGKKGLGGVEHSWRQARQKNCEKREVKSDSKDHMERVRHAHQQNVNEVTHLGCEFSALDCGTRRENYKGGCLAQFPRMNGATGLPLDFDFGGAVGIVGGWLACSRPVSTLVEEIGHFQTQISSIG